MYQYVHSYRKWYYWVISAIALASGGSCIGFLTTGTEPVDHSVWLWPLFMIGMGFLGILLIFRGDKWTLTVSDEGVAWDGPRGRGAIAKKDLRKVTIDRHGDGIFATLLKYDGKTIYLEPCFMCDVRGFENAVQRHMGDIELTSEP